MNQEKEIRKILATNPVQLGTETLAQALPLDGIEHIDPFLLIQHANLPLPGGHRQRDVGVGGHPHRGFSPVTFVFRGSVHHRDSLENDSVVFEGGTQWMHAGSGIWHSERPGKELAETGGENEFVQFWVNTPAKHKMDAPFYQPISQEETPAIEKPKATISVVAGDFEGKKGIAQPLSPQILLRLETLAGADFTLDIPEAYNCLLYLLDGGLIVNGQAVSGKEMVWFEQKGETIRLEAEQNTRAILLSGQPIGETVVSYGPFVMNTQAEIQATLQDSKRGKLGRLKEKF